VNGPPVWLALDPDPVLCTVHEASSGASGSAVLIVPPFGWDEMCSYRPRRAWADALAAAGHSCARIDLPSTGDSGGVPSGPDRVDAWVRAVGQSAAWLRERAAATRLVAIGIGLGGMLAYRAAADGARIDDLVLWGVPARGRRLIRELRAQAAMIADRHPEDANSGAPPPDRAWAAAGYLLSAQTTDALSRLDLTDHPLPAGQRRRALVLRRGGLGHDEQLVEHLAALGAAVEVADGPGYDEMMAPPQQARAPGEVIERTIAWIDSGRERGAAVERAGGGAVPSERSAIELAWPAGTVRERALRFELGGREVTGIVSEPVAATVAPVCGILFNAGAVRRIGPSRTWVELSRGWAARGVPTVRVDFPGIGDSDGSDTRYVKNAAFYTPDHIELTRSLVDAIGQLEFPSRFVLGGLCSGAHWALHGSVGDRRIAAALTVNLFPVFWSPELHDEWETRKVVTSLRGRGWRRLARGDFDLAELRRALRSIRPVRLVAEREGASYIEHSDRLDRILDGLRDQDSDVLLLLGRGEPLYYQFVRERRLERLAQWPNVALERISSADHSFRALSVQQEVKGAFDRALDRVLQKSARQLGELTQ
jgi:pimeloyl-ACP methyl ester carboxylesterase